MTEVDFIKNQIYDIINVQLSNASNDYFEEDTGAEHLLPGDINCGNDIPFVIAIDGRSAAGKTTLAKLLSQRLGCDVVHMDDFFVPLPLRTPKRYELPGANVHYERFIEEVLPYLHKDEAFSYSFFDCLIMDFNGKRKIERSHYRIVEGSYSHHANFEEYADLKIFIDIDEKTQMERILKRNGEEKAVRFKNEWIPLEELYFSKCDIKNKSDLIIENNKVLLNSYNNQDK